MKNDKITNYIVNFESKKVKRLEHLRTLIHETIPEIDEKIWSGVPCFYTNEIFILVRVFKDHINLVADSIIDFKDELTKYKITPNGMLQIYDDQELPLSTLKKILSTCSKNTK